ncbi:MAG TPA: MFS transporter [Actinomycetota bacterium]
MRSPRRLAPLVSLLAADAISLAGNTAALVAIPWFVLQTTGSASKTGITAAAGIVPVIVSGVFGGAIVDRLGYRRASVVADLASAAAVAAIPLLHGTVGLEFWQLVVLVFLGALLDAPGVSARASLLPEVAEPAGWSLEGVSGAWAAVSRGARLAGAPIAGVLIAVVGPTNVLWIDAATFLVSAGAIAVGVPRRAQEPTEAPDEPRTGYLGEIAEGFRFLVERRVLLTLTLVVAVTNMLDSVAMVALPVLAKDVYGTPWSLGLMLGITSAGSVVGAVAFSAVGERLSRRRVFTWGFGGATLWYPVAALFPPLGAMLAVRGLSGLLTGPINPVIDTVILEQVPDGMRGRVFSVGNAAAWIAMPIGVLLAGPAIEAFGLRATLLVTAGLYVVVAALTIRAPSLAGLDARTVPGRAPEASASPQPV